MTDAKDLQIHISALLDTYITFFSASNLSAAASYYHEPATAISASGVLIYHTRADVEATLTTTLTRLKDQGWTYSEWVGDKKIEVPDMKGLLSVRVPCKRARDDGSSVEDFIATYVLRKVGEEWLIASVTSSPIDSNG